jgi:hypothetical protein
MAAALTLLLGGFAYVRKRFTRPGHGLPAAASFDEPPEPHLGAHSVPVPLDPVPASSTSKLEHSEKIPAAAPVAVAKSAAVAFPQVAFPQVAIPQIALPDATTHALAQHTGDDVDTDYMGIDAQALERSYLEGLATDSIHTDTAAHPVLAHDSTPHDTEAHIPPAHDLETHDPRPPVTALAADDTVVAAPRLDYDLLDLDATQQHVQLPSHLQDPADITEERRTNIVDALKVAIDRDPHRRDLVVKLLETYYSTASSNQREFLEVVRKLAREPDFLTKEDWRKVELMGRDIAPHDPLFADNAQGGRLANCA